MSTEWNQDSLEFIFNHIREAPEKQIQSADSLDTKMVQIFVSASIIIGLVGLSSDSFSTGGWEVFPLLGALLTYGFVAGVAFIHLRPREMRRNLHADTLWPEYGKYSVEDIKELLAQDTSDAYEFNKVVLADKAITIRQALFATALEVVLVGIAIATPLMKAWFT